MVLFRERGLNFDSSVPHERELQSSSLLILKHTVLREPLCEEWAHISVLLEHVYSHKDMFIVVMPWTKIHRSRTDTCVSLRIDTKG